MQIGSDMLYKMIPTYLECFGSRAFSRYHPSGCGSAQSDPAERKRRLQILREPSRCGESSRRRPQACEPFTMQ
jgi:hypothetical protein